MSQNSELRVPYGLSVHGEEEIEAVIEVLRTTTQMSKNVSSFEGKIAELFSMDYGVMVNSGSSALKLRGCFKVDPMFFKNQVLAEKPTPLAAPFWFKCFDYEYLHQEIASGRAKAYLAAKDEYDGIDRMVLVFDSGEAYQWRQLNSKFSGK